MDPGNGYEYIALLMIDLETEIAALNDLLVSRPMNFSNSGKENLMPSSFAQTSQIKLTGLKLGARIDPLTAVGRPG